MQKQEDDKCNIVQSPVGQTSNAQPKWPPADEGGRERRLTHMLPLNRDSLLAVVNHRADAGQRGKTVGWG